MCAMNRRDFMKSTAALSFFGLAPNLSGQAATIKNGHHRSRIWWVGCHLLHGPTKHIGHHRRSRLE